MYSYGGNLLPSLLFSFPCTKMCVPRCHDAVRTAIFILQLSDKQVFHVVMASTSAGIAGLIMCPNTVEPLYGRH